MIETRFTGLRLRTVLALLTAMGALAFASAPARAAVSITSFTVTPSTTQAGANPNVEIDAQLATADGDTPSAVTLGLAPGLLANPTVAAVCSAADYAVQECPATSEIGSGTITGYVPEFGTSASLPTQMYLIQPSGSAIAEIGLIADFYDYPAANVSSPVVIRTTPTFGIDIPITGIPDEFDDGGTEIPIQVQGIDLTLDGTVNGQPFTRNPTSCVPASTTFSLTSYLAPSTPVSTSASYGVTGCDSLAYSPQLSGTAALDQTDTGVDFTATVTQSATDAATGELAMVLPSGLSPRLSALGSACSADDLSSCTAVGSATVTTPLLANPVTGQIDLVSSGSLLPYIDVVLPSPLGITLQGTASLAGGGLAATFSGLPDVPLTSLSVSFSGGANSLFTANDEICASTQTLGGTLTAQDGATVAVSGPVAVTGTANCPAPPSGSGSSGSGSSGSGSSGSGSSGSGSSGSGSGSSGSGSSGSGTSGSSGSGSSGTGSTGTGTSGSTGGGTSGTGSGKNTSGVHTTAGAPTGVARVSGLQTKHPSLTVTVTAGKNAPLLKGVAIRLPGGFTLNRKRFPSGVRGRVGARTLDHRAITLVDGVSFALGSGGRTATFTFATPALQLPAGVAAKLRRHQTITLTFLVTVHDQKNTQTKLRLTVRVS